MNFLSKTLIIGSLFLIALGIWGRVHVIISGSMILKIIGAIGIVAGISLSLKGTNSQNNNKKY